MNSKELDKVFVIEKINEKFKKYKYNFGLPSTIVNLVISTSYKNLAILRETNQLNWRNFGGFNLYTKSDIADYILKNINKKNFKILN
jgi:hypothetical protein